MTSASLALSAPAESSRKAARWGSRIVEFLVVGGLTLLLYPLAYLYRTRAGLEESEYIVSFAAFYAAYVINDPHFAVTYLLFYKGARQRAFGTVFDPVQRIRYIVAGIVVPVVLASWAAWALATRSGEIMGWMIQMMFFLVGWHYVKQGFGVFTVLSARRGVRLSSVERWVVLGHCFAGWAYGWSSPADPGSEFQESGVVYRSFPHGAALETVTQIAFWLSAVLLVGVLARKAVVERRFPALAPLTGMLMSVWAWTVYSGIDPLMGYVIPGLHSLQYLYFVWLLKRNEARAASAAVDSKLSARLRLGILAGSALALGWFLFRSGPQFFDETVALGATIAPSTVPTLGATPFLAAFLTFVNVHHYFMDHVIWRRDNPDTRFLRG